MENNKILSSLSYFSILFAPFILPIIVFFVSQDKDVKYHAKRSVISHLIPVILMIIAFIGMITSMFTFSATSAYDDSSFLFAAAPAIFMLVYFIIYVIVLVWNIIQGVKVLR